MPNRIDNILRALRQEALQSVDVVFADLHGAFALRPRILQLLDNASQFFSGGFRFFGGGFQEPA